MKGIRTLLLVAAVAAAVPSLSAQTSPFAGNAFGRCLIAGDGLGRGLDGVAQQSITPVRGGGLNIYSSAIAASTPVALGISDRIQIRGRRVVFRTDFDPALGNCPQRRATGTARIRGNVITYSARTADGDLRVSGTIRVSGKTISRRETRREDGGILTQRLTVFR